MKITLFYWIGLQPYNLDGIENGQGNGDSGRLELKADATSGYLHCLPYNSSPSYNIWLFLKKLGSLSIVFIDRDGICHSPLLSTILYQTWRYVCKHLFW